MIISRTMFDIGLSFDRPGKTNSLPAASSFAFSNSSTQRGASGTLCSLPAFMRSAGTVQVAWSRSISHHFASSTSLVRAAVRMRNSNAKLAIAGSPSCSLRTKAGTSVYGRAAK